MAGRRARRFNELRYYEAYAPRDVAWWWDTVIGMPRPSKPLNSPITAFANHGEYLDSIYNQGARYLDMLRARLGTVTFDVSLRDLYNVACSLDHHAWLLEILSGRTRLSQRALQGRFFQ